MKVFKVLEMNSNPGEIREKHSIAAHSLQEAKKVASDAGFDLNSLTEIIHDDNGELTEKVKPITKQEYEFSDLVIRALRDLQPGVVISIHKNIIGDLQLTIDYDQRNRTDLPSFDANCFKRGVQHT